MNKWTISQRIIATTGFLCVIIGLFSIAVIFEIKQIKEKNDFITQHNIVCMLSASRMNINLGDNILKTYQLVYDAATPEEKRSLLSSMEAASKLNNDFSQKYEDAVLSEDNRKLYSDFTSKQQTYRDSRKKLLSMLDANLNRTETEKFLREVVVPAYKEYSNAGNILLDFNEKSVDNKSQELETTISWIITLFTSAGVIAILIGITASFFGIRSINSALKKISDVLGNNAEQVASASGQVSASSQSLAESSSEQAASLEETSSSLEEMTSTIGHNDEHSQAARELAAETLNAAQLGEEDMKQLDSAMDDIQKSSDDISKIIKTIDEIAFQTNILALNAAVEAARAGDAGMGFAVVADEVRNLAQRSALAAKETSNKIQDATSKSAQGITYSTKVGQSLSLIVQKAQKMNELVTEIATASKEQRQGINQINIAVNQMDKITQTNAAGAEEAASASEELNAQAEEMKSSVQELLELVNGQKSQNRPVGNLRKMSTKAPFSMNGNHSRKSFSLPSSKQDTPSRTVTSRTQSRIPLDKDFEEM